MNTVTISGRILSPSYTYFFGYKQTSVKEDVVVWATLSFMETNP